MSFAKKLARKREKSGVKKIVGHVKARHKVEKDTRRAYIRQNVSDMVLRMEAFNNVMDILLVAARETFGFGKKRLGALYKRMLSHSECIRTGYVTVEDICQILRDEAKLDIRDSREPKVDRQRRIQYKVIDELSAAFMLSLMDEFGYKGKLLGRAYSRAAQISEKLETHEMGISDLEEILARAKFAFER
jgi:hypothetical protein